MSQQPNRAAWYAKLAFAYATSFVVGLAIYPFLLVGYVARRTFAEIRGICATGAVVLMAIKSFLRLNKAPPATPEIPQTVEVEILDDAPTEPTRPPATPMPSGGVDRSE